MMSTDPGHEPDAQADPQTHLAADPANEPDTVDDPAHDTDEDEGWGSEGGATPTGPATSAASSASIHRIIR